MSENGDGLGALASDKTLENAKDGFMSLLSTLNSENDRASFLKWVGVSIKEMKSNGFGSNSVGNLLESRKRLYAISDDLRAQLPVEAVMPTEDIRPPTVGSDAGINPRHVIHLDAFVYDEVHENILEEEGKLSKSFCTKCGCTDIEDFGKKIDIFLFLQFF